MHGLTAPALLRDKLGDNGADALTDMFDHASALAAERYERRLAEETSRIRLEIADLKFELITWMFLFWIGQVAASLAVARLFD